MHSAPSPAADPQPAQVAESPPENPYVAPTATGTESPYATKMKNKFKEPISHQAAKFSAYAPFILFLMGTCVQGQLRATAGTDAGRGIAMTVAALSVTTTVAAFVLGLVGLFGGISRGAIGTIVYSIIGLLLNGGLVAIWIFGLYALMRH